MFSVSFSVDVPKDALSANGNFFGGFLGYMICVAGAVGCRQFPAGNLARKNDIYWFCPAKKGQKKAEEIFPGRKKASLIFFLQNRPS
jgi:hypothetical protein